MNILQSDVIDDIFIEICKYLEFEQLLELQLLSKYNGKLIRKTRWDHTDVRLRDTKDIDDKVIHLATNFNFGIYDLTECVRVTDKSVKMLWNCDYMHLNIHHKITNSCIQTMREKMVKNKIKK